MADDFKNKTYLGLIEMLGPEKSKLLIDQLFKDLILTRNNLIKAQSKKSMKILDASTHVLSSLAGTVGLSSIGQLARDVNDHAVVKDAHFPKEDVAFLLSNLEPWVDFLLVESQAFGLET